MLAPGDAILSAQARPDLDHVYCARDPFAPNAAIQALSGTSVSCAHAAAGAALVQQYYTAGFHPNGPVSQPSAALIKATLINSAKDLMGQLFYDATAGQVVQLSPTAGHQFVSGYGRVQLDRSLALRDATTGQYSPVLQFYDNQQLAPDLSSAWSHDIYLAPNNSFLSVTLVWNDPPAAYGAQYQLVNDLDLIVFRPDCGSEEGNAYLHLWHIADLRFAPVFQPRHGRFKDRVNNVERVYLPAPPAGAYRVEVRAARPLFGPQPWSLVINFQSESGPPAAPQSMCPSHMPVLHPDHVPMEAHVTVRVIDLSVFSVDRMLAMIGASLAINYKERMRQESFDKITGDFVFIIADICIDSGPRQSLFEPDLTQPTAAYLASVFVAMMANPTSVLFLDSLDTATLNLDRATPVTVTLEPSPLPCLAPATTSLPPEPEPPSSEPTQTRLLLKWYLWAGLVGGGVCVGVLVLVARRGRWCCAAADSNPTLMDIQLQASDQS